MNCKDAMKKSEFHVLVASCKEDNIECRNCSHENCPLIPDRYKKGRGNNDN